MSYKTILSYVHEKSYANAVLDLAIGLAADEKAHLIGLHIAQEIEPYSSVGFRIPETVVNEQLRQSAIEMELLQKVFADKTQEIGISGEWRTDSSTSTFAADKLRANACTADIIVCPAANPLDNLEPWSDIT